MSGYFKALRRTHPAKIGDLVDGQRVVSTSCMMRPLLENRRLTVVQVYGGQYYYLDANHTWALLPDTEAV